MESADHSSHASAKQDSLELTVQQFFKDAVQTIVLNLRLEASASKLLQAKASANATQADTASIVSMTQIQSPPQRYLATLVP